MSTPSDRHYQVRLQNSRDISAMFAKYAIQKGMIEGVALRWNGAEWPLERRENHELEFVAGQRVVRKKLSDTALLHMDARVCFDYIWTLIREAVEELQGGLA